MTDFQQHNLAHLRNKAGAQRDIIILLKYLVAVLGMDALNLVRNSRDQPAHEANRFWSRHRATLPVRLSDQFENRKLTSLLMLK
jgi:hypothetical protein